MYPTGDGDRSLTSAVFRAVAFDAAAVEGIATLARTPEVLVADRLAAALLREFGSVIAATMPSPELLQKLAVALAAAIQAPLDQRPTQMYPLYEAPDVFAMLYRTLQEPGFAGYLRTLSQGITLDRNAELTNRSAMTLLLPVLARGIAQVRRDQSDTVQLTASPDLLALLRLLPLANRTHGLGLISALADPKIWELLDKKRWHRRDVLDPLIQVGYLGGSSETGIVERGQFTAVRTHVGAFLATAATTASTRLVMALALALSSSAQLQLTERRARSPIPDETVARPGLDVAAEERLVEVGALSHNSTQKKRITELIRTARSSANELSHGGPQTGRDSGQHQL